MLALDALRRSGRWWLVALAFALAFLAVDSVVRLRRVDALTTASVGSGRTIAADDATITGYEGNQHDVVLGRLGADGYHWVMQAQHLLASRDLRVRAVEYDGPPGGRPAHWSSFLHWWTLGTARIASAVTGDPVMRAVERVAPWANTLLLALLLVVVVPLVALRFGAAPASLLAVGTVATYPVYEFFAVGNLDHHGIATFAAMLSVLCLLAGGGGWVRGAAAMQEPNARNPRRSPDAGWLPDAKGARRWFVAAGVAGAVGLWVSAATQVPTLIAIGIAALVNAAHAGRHDTAGEGWNPQLWRLWGTAGCLASLAFYALEYLPSHAALRLEVNHPLYALAWLAAGDLLCRVARHASQGGRRAATPGDNAGALLDVLVIGIVPATVLLVPESFGLRPDSLLGVLHEDYIDEFQPLLRQLAAASPVEIIAGIGLLPLMLAPVAAVAAFGRKFAGPLRALVWLSALPAVAFTVLAFRHGRWMGVAAALWLVVLMTLAFVTGIRWPGASRTRPLWTALVIAALGVAFIPFPAVSVQRWMSGDWVYPVAASELSELVTRDVSRKLRARLGTERGFVASGPTTTTWMAYYGGVRGLGTLYWENREGVAAAAALFGASPSVAGRSAADSALGIIERLGITHIALFSWGPFAVEYAALARGLRGGTVAAAAATRDAFGPQLLQGNLPPWLRPLPYRVPPVPGLGSAWALILEVLPEQTDREAAVRFAQFSLALGDVDRAVAQLRSVLATNPEYLPALISLARVEHDDPARGDYGSTLARIRSAPRPAAGLAFEDAIGLAAVYSLASDSAAARSVLADAIERADERSVRRLPWDYTGANLMVLARQLGLLQLRPDITELAYQLLDPPLQAQVPFPR